MSRTNPGLSWITEELESLDGRGLRRKLAAVLDRRPGQILLSDRWLTDFSGNDYLGFNHHPSCHEAALKALQQGCGSGGSRLVTGGGREHGALERALEQLFSASAVVFPSGYQANVGMLSALCRPGDTIFSDEHNHASIVDGCRLSGAHIQVYPHRQTGALENALRKTVGRRWIVTDAVFSMDGSLAPVVELNQLSERYHAPLLVDEAHALGVIGPGGRGLCAAEGVEPAVLMGTFSKGLGSHGAFTISSDSVAQWLVNRARSFMYTTALPPAVLAVNHQALQLSAGQAGSERRQKVRSLAHELRRRLRESGLEASGDGTPIVSLSYNEATQATALQHRLLRRGHLAWAFRPPTVPANSSRLRISVSASHETSQVEDLARTLINLSLSPNGTSEITWKA